MTGTEVASPPTRARRPGRPREEHLETVILDAAIDELIERGHLGLSMERVAARAGVAKTTVYRRWPSKDELMIDALSTSKGPMPDPVSGPVRDCVLQLLDWMRISWLDTRHGQLMRRLASDSSEHPELYRTFRDRVVQPRLAVLREVIQRARREGLIRADVDVDDVQWLLTAPSLAAAMTHRPQPTPAQLMFFVDTVLAGLAP